jgi:UDP-N-acetylglucosamine transferase subunit ALG13
LIFVSVGTPDRPFNRLIEEIDKIACKTGEKIIAQIGHSTYIPQNIEFFRFCERDRMLSYVNAASLIISQAGFGIIGDSINFNKPMILVPREVKLGEAIDKQYELAEYLSSQNKSILCIRDISLLSNAVKEIRKAQVQYNYKTIIPSLINDFISEYFN